MRIGTQEVREPRIARATDAEIITFVARSTAQTVRDALGAKLHLLTAQLESHDRAVAAMPDCPHKDHVICSAEKLKRSVSDLVGELKGEGGIL